MKEILSHLDENTLNAYKEKLLLIKKNHQIIAEEASKISIKDYLPFNDGNINNNYWNVYLIKSKNKKNDRLNLTPRTYEILSEHIFSNAFFSLLKPKTVIHPHKDILFYLYRSHLGLDVPDDYRFLCDDIDITTKNGEINFFDLTCKHEAYNMSDKHRVVLIVDILKTKYDNLPFLTV